jgi:hypothetical protein
MADNTVHSVHINQALTNMSVGWHPMGLIAEQVMQVVPVKNESDFYYVWNKGDALRRVDTRWGDGTRANRVDFGYSTKSYICEPFGLELVMTDRQRRNADSILNLALAKTRRAQGLILIDQENRVADLYTTLANYATTNRVTLSGTDQWNNASFTGNIEKVFDDAKEAVRLNSFNNMKPEIAIIPEPVAKVIKRDAKVREVLKYTHSDLIVNGDLPKTLWNLSVVIPSAVTPTDREIFGADAPNAADIWGKHVVLTMRPSAVSLDTPAHAYIMRAQDVRVEQWRDESIQSDMYRVSYVQCEHIVSNVGGYLMRDVIA